MNRASRPAAAAAHGLPERLANELKMRVWVASDPMTCVVRGAGSILEDLDNNKPFLTGLDRGTV
jgi:rod shape-determining protein MreB